jgi:hypothetical protein
MKTKLVPFDIEKAKQGAKVVTRDGRNVRIGFFDLKDKEYPVVGAVETNNVEGVIYFSKEGKYNSFEGENNLDLFIEEEIKTRRMTIKELAWWLRDHPEEHREFKYKDTQKVDSHGSYNECDQNEECNQNIVVRKNGGEWQEPLVEI